MNDSISPNLTLFPPNSCEPSMKGCENMNNFVYPLITAGLAAFVTYSGYCVYKHTQEKFHTTCTYSLFESRLIEILHAEASKSGSYNGLNKLSSPISRREYFMKKVQAANKCIRAGDEDLSIYYLILAMAVCSKPATLLRCMATTLPMNVYKKLIEKLSSLT